MNCVTWLNGSQDIERKTRFFLYVDTKFIG